MKRGRIIAWVLAAGIAGGMAAGGAARAEHTRTWTQSEYSEFDRGTAKGVALRSDGKLMPAPKFTDFSDPNLAYIWMLKVDSRGRVYAAGGSNAKVLRFDDPAKPTTVFESPELAAQAIAFDKQDNLYVGTSPDGKVYKVTPNGKKSVFFDPKTKYIWALALDGQGNLFVATGDKGEVYVVGPDGKGQVFYQSDERHARSLAMDAQGNLIIGTDPNGLVVRVAMERKGAQALPTAGAAYVLYETDKKEVTSLLEDGKGNLYAAAIGEKPRPAATPLAAAAIAAAQQAASQAAAAQAGGGAQGATGLAPTITFPYFPVTAGGASVVKIAADGSPEELWSSREELVFAMGFSADGKLLLGTGNKGAIIELEGNGVFSSVAKTASAQAMSLATAADGKIYVGTANPGKIITLGPGYEENGSFESEPFDGKIFSKWGRLTWWGENGATQGKVAFYVRSGNTSSPEKDWSEWAGPYSSLNGDGSSAVTASGQTVTCPAARFAQWKAVFVETDHGGAPYISWVTLAYQPKNVAPQVDDIVMQDAGVRVQGFAQQSGPGNLTPVQLRMPQRAGAANNFGMVTGNAEGNNRAGKVDVPPQGFEERGYQSVLWSAHDDNDDDLIFAVYYRGEREHDWRLLKDKLTQKYYSWDTTTMPDGAYYLKVTASDQPSNPPSEALTAEREGDRFEIGNTPPRIERLRAETNGAGAKVSFDGISAAGAIEQAQYSVDAGDWLIVFPVGQLSDAAKESYEIDLTGLAPGAHIVSVQVGDAFGNTTAAKTAFNVAARGGK
ncbi:MAG: hypothetical protein WBX12_06090 [Candidatus Acidiferrales bacterium]